MSDVIAGFLEIGCDDKHQVVINHPDLKPDENGVGHIVFSPRQARRLAELLLKHAVMAEREQIAACFAPGWPPSGLENL